MVQKNIKFKDHREVNLVGEWTKIKAKGIFNIEDLYIELYYWFIHYDFDWKEVEYRVNKFGGGAKRLEITWIGDKGYSDYTTFRIKLNVAIDMKDVEVTLDGGKKVDRQKATVEFRTGAWLYHNEGIFKDRPFGKIMKNVYEILKRPLLEQHEDDAFGEAMKLYNELKAFMLLYKH